MLRKITTVGLVLLSLFFWYITLTVPMITATTPGMIAIALDIAAYFLWPKKNAPRSLPIKE